jgi:hypothetical protein
VCVCVCVCKGVAQVEHVLSRKVEVREGLYMCVYEALSS